MQPKRPLVILDGKPIRWRKVNINRSMYGSVIAYVDTRNVCHFHDVASIMQCKRRSGRDVYEVQTGRPPWLYASY